MIARVRYILLALAILCITGSFSFEAYTRAQAAQESDFELVTRLIRSKPNLGNVPEGWSPTAGIVQLPARKLDISGTIRLLPGIVIRGQGTETVMHALKGPLFMHVTEAGHGHAARQSIESMAIHIEDGDAIVIGDNKNTEGQPQESSFFSVRDVLFNVPNGIAINWRSPNGQWTYRGVVERCNFYNVWKAVDFLGEYITLRGNDHTGGRVPSPRGMPDADYTIEGGWQNCVEGNYYAVNRNTTWLRLINTRATIMGNVVEPANKNVPLMEFIASDVVMDHSDSWPDAPVYLRKSSSVNMIGKIYSAPISAAWRGDGSANKLRENGTLKSVGAIR